jgi:type VI secretion system secreted protein VgrG
MASVKADTAQYACEIAGQTFQILNIDIQEEMSDLYRIGLNLWLDNPEVAIQPMLRQPVEITISWESKEKKYFGIVASIRQTEAGRIGAVEQEYGHYAVEVVPNLWTLSHRTNCRIFQNMPVNEIVSKVLKERCPTQQVDIKLQKSYQPREYCVQYRETDLAFISRLMEEEGIFYYFTHDGPEKMVIGDSPNAYGTCAPEDTASYAKPTGGLSTAKEYFDQLTYEENVYSGKVSFKDFNYSEPKLPLKVEASAEKQTDLEIFDFHPRRYAADGLGRSLATVAMEAQSAMRTQLEASGNWRSVSAGCMFTLEKAYRADLNKTWLIVSASHSASQVGGTDHQVSIVAIPADTVFRPLPVTPQPALNPHTATVVGPAGKEIYMDDEGRAKVQFHWDLEGKRDENTTCWIRVAQHYAGFNEESGKKHGFHWHPLIGDEVIVDFLEGDPDNPIIVGSVYNGFNKPIISPDQHIRNIILTRYQHRLLFDDKNKAITLNTPYAHTLHMNDPNKSITLNTRYNHQLKMWDPHKDNDEVPHIHMSTGSGQEILLEDSHKELGHHIQIATADGHLMTMDEGSQARGTVLQTKDLNQIFLNDKEEQIFIDTKNHHSVLLDDKNKTIVVTSTDKHRIEISDKDKKIEVADSSGKHRFTIDIGSQQLTISTDTGSIDILAPKGEVKLDARSIALKAQTDVSIDCKDMKTDAKGNIDTKAGMNLKAKAGMKHELEGMSIKEKAQMEIKMEAMNVTSKAQMMNKTQGMMVNSSANGINNLKGMLVKIN